MLYEGLGFVVMLVYVEIIFDNIDKCFSELGDEVVIWWMIVFKKDEYFVD